MCVCILKNLFRFVFLLRLSLSFSLASDKERMLHCKKSPLEKSLNEAQEQVKGICGKREQQLRSTSGRIMSDMFEGQQKGPV